MNILIIENDVSEAERLKDLFNKNYPEITNVVCCSTECCEVKESAKVGPNIVFVNKEDWIEKGKDLLADEKFSRAAIVITTKDKNAALEAFKFDAESYLRIPVQEADLVKTVDQIIKNNIEISDNGDLSYFKELIESEKLNKIALTTLEGYTLVSYEDIVRCEAKGNYTNVYFFDGSFLMLTKTLKHYDNILSERGFFRVHKTHLVNLNYIVSFYKGKSNYVKLKDNTEIEVSVRKKDLLLQKLTT